jgi:histidine ammonia-lyase
VNSVIKEAIASAARLELPQTLLSAASRVDENFLAFQAYHARNPQRGIYGVNVMPGHQDFISVDGLESDELQRRMIAGHALSDRPAYSRFEARCIGYAKAYAVAAGGSLISRDLYRLICEGIIDPTFEPDIPGSSSYSCGDVIPAAHWTEGLLKRRPYRLKAGEAMAMLSGSFVHVGLALALTKRVWRLWSLFVESSRCVAVASSANPSAFRGWDQSDTKGVVEAARYISEDLPSKNADIPQDPVSLRATPQTLDCLYGAITTFASELDRSIARPSGNPLMVSTADGMQPVPHGSFMNPALTIASSAVIDAALLCGWCSVQRTKHLLSGRADPVPLDGKKGNEDLGLIQWPKLMQAFLENARIVARGRPFASGGATSLGVEDLWSFGVATVELSNRMLDEIERILCFEISIAVRCAYRFKNAKLIAESELNDLLCNSPNPRGLLEPILAWVESSPRSHQIG